MSQPPKKKSTQNLKKSLFLFTTLLVKACSAFDASDTNDHHSVRHQGGAVNTQLNSTFYLGKTYEYAYDKTYWTIGLVRFFNSTLNDKTDVFCQTSYIFLENEWAGSEEHPMIFKIDPVSIFRGFWL
jgi:hypothetical protein